MKKLMMTAVALAALGTAPAVAQGCGMMSQPASSPAGASSAGGMCGRPAAATQAQAQPGQTSPSKEAGGCSCCRNMAMMQAPNQGMGSMPGMQHNMPSAPSTPPTPDAPKPQ